MPPNARLKASIGREQTVECLKHHFTTVRLSNVNLNIDSVFGFMKVLLVNACVKKMKISCYDISKRLSSIEDELHLLKWASNHAVMNLEAYLLLRIKFSDYTAVCLPFV